jgi:hypothetical protein
VGGGMGGVGGVLDHRPTAGISSGRVGGGWAPAGLALAVRVSSSSTPSERRMEFTLDILVVLL